MDDIKTNILVVYTALFGDYDDLIDPKEDYNGCIFICFTDQKHLKSNIWEIRVIEDIDLPLNMMNRRYKILPHLFLSEYEQSLYIDANIGILENPRYLSSKYLKKNHFYMPKHFDRNCIYEEAKECIVLSKSDFFKTKKQIKMYQVDGFPKAFGMGENNILLRTHNEQVIVSIMENWWQELLHGVKRDQLSLAYILWKHNKRFNYLTEHARDKKYFTYTKHHNEKKIRVLEDIKNRLVIKIKQVMIILFYDV